MGRDARNRKRSGATPARAQEHPPAAQDDLSFYDEGTAGAALDYIMRQARTFQERGDWFERLTLNLMAAERDLDVAEAWLWLDWPNKPRDRGAQDLGVDIVANSNDGRTVAVQCKCLDDGASLTKAAIDSFIAEAVGRDAYDELWLVTNAPLGRNASAAFEGLDKPCRHILFQRYADTRLDVGESPHRREAMPLQQRAIESVVAGFAGDNPQDRGKLVMACGTGKTFTALRIAEALHPADNVRFLFAAPSIALVGQARREWLRHCDEPMSTLVVCSSKAQGRSREDAADVSAHELACPVTTDAAEIAAFLKRRGKRQAVFCTYQSLGRVSDAQTEHRAPAFDLAVADEAHRTTGEFDKTGEGRKIDWRLIHDGERLNAKRRLYMTATPRVYTPESVETARKHGVAVVGMNSPEYGPTFHTLSFRDAVGNGVLCDYRVIVLALDNRTRLTAAVRKAFDEATDDVRSRRKRAATHSEQVRLLGTSLAVNGAIVGDEIELPKCLPRTLAFANKCAMSEWVAKAISDSRTQRLTSYRIKGDRTARKVNAEHLDATTPDQKRIVELDKLRNASDDECRMICNVRLFSEGIDIPALDGIVFFEGRRSHIDVVQAVGRVMRKAEGKKLGYIVVPIVVPPGENLLDALANSDEGFDRIGDVLCALQSHDPSLADRMQEYVVLAQPAEERNGKGEGKRESGKNDLKNMELAFNLSEAKDAVYAYIGGAAGFSNRKDLVEGHIRSAVTTAADLLIDAELASPLGDALSLPIREKEERRNAATLAALLLVNALILSHRLVPRFPEIDDDSIQRARFAGRPYALLRHAWRTILAKDYAPIFAPALAALEVIKAPGHARILNHLAEAALEAASAISDFSYDHSGPLFHRILGKRGMADGAFYTNNLAALLLAGLAIPRNPEKTLRVLDPACGTGTLLLAVMDTIKRHIVADHPRTDLEKLHKRLVEQTIHGLDINHHATQLAAMNLTLGAPTVDYERMNVATVREGVHDGTPHAGSLELLPLDGQRSLDALRPPLPTLDALPGATDSARFDPEGMDIIISNPPYTEINKQLSKLAAEQDRVSMRRHFKTLKGRLANVMPDATETLSGTRALGPFFLPLAHHLLKAESGTLALVRATSALTAPSGLAERKYLADHFHVETVVTSHAPNNSAGLGINFSESTNVNESLLVLRRRIRNQGRLPTTAIALHRQPSSRMEVLELLDGVSNSDVSEFGRMTSWPAERIEAGDWSFANWYDSGLAELAALVDASTRLAPLVRHADFVMPSPNFAKVYEEALDKAGSVPMFESAASDVIQYMRARPSSAVQLKADADMKHHHSIKHCTAFLAFRVRGGTSRILAFLTGRRALSTAFNGLVVRGNQSYARALVAFLNSTLGWLQVLNNRAFTLEYTRIKPITAKRLKVPPPDSPHIPTLAEP